MVENFKEQSENIVGVLEIRGKIKGIRKFLIQIKSGTELAKGQTFLHQFLDSRRPNLC